MSMTSLDPAGVHIEDLPEQIWPRQEIIDGSLHVTPYAGLHHQVVVTRLSRELARIAPEDLEVLAGANILRRSDTDRLLIPDVVVVDTVVALKGGAAAPPEAVYLAAEVISPSSRATDLHLKKQLYDEWGIGTYLVLDADTQTLHEFGLRDTASTWLHEVNLDSVWPG